MLSRQPALDTALRTLLTEAVPRILERNARLQPRLLLLMGSAAVGEASGVAIGGEWLPLSDLDLALFTERPGAHDWGPRMRRTLEADLGAHRQALGLTVNPLDVGLLPRAFYARTPLTLELAEALTHGVVLWGDAALLAPRRGELPRRFEALRLLGNRVRETLLPPGEASALRFDPPAGPAWASTPGPEAWREAHRWGKLVLDGAKAYLAAGGLLEPSLAKRAARLAQGAGTLAPLDAAAAEQVRRWSAWRLEPAWPPPPLALDAVARVGLGVVTPAAVAAGARDWPAPDRAVWRRMLAEEGGAPRERLRCWLRLARRGGPPQAPGAGLRLALAWGARAWPVSLATLALSSVWFAAIADREAAAGDAGAALRDWLRGALAPCRRASAHGWDASWARGLEDWFTWLAAAGL
jgi:hypothetical protein